MQLFLGEIFEVYAEIYQEEAKHLVKVLRKNIGDVIYVTNGKGLIIEGNIIGIQKLKIIIEIRKEIIDNQKRNYFLHLAICPTKNIDRFEFFLEKATEIGVDEITPLLSDHSERKNINQERLNKILITAGKQSLKANFPKLNPLVTVSSFIKSNANKDINLACCSKFNQKTEIKELKISNNVIFMIGPEGDFSKAEIDLAIENNIKLISLGRQRLRTETAGIFISNFMYLFK